METRRVKLAFTVAVPLMVGALAAVPTAVRAADDRPAAAVDARAGNAEELENARGLVREAVEVVGQMKRNPAMKGALQRAKGILIVPDYVRAALGVGGRGGAGVLLEHHDDGRWSGPVFYNTGGVSVGVQAGAEAGSAAFLLMTQKAVDAFKGKGTFSLNADAGYSIIDQSAMAQVTAGRNVDVAAWSDTEGLFAGATISLTGVQWDEDETRAYYDAQNVTPAAILSGELPARQSASETAELQKALKP